MNGSEAGRAAALVVLLATMGCGQSWGQVATTPASAATSESGQELVFRVELLTGETATWSVEPNVGTLSTSDTTGSQVTYTPPASLERRDAFTGLTLSVNTSKRRGTASIAVYPDPCGAGGRWASPDPLVVPGPPDACGPCEVGPKAYGDLTPPSSLLLGGTLRQGALTETFDVASCTWTVTAPDDGSVNDFCTWGTVSPPYAGVVAHFTFAPGQDTVSGQQRWVCWGATACCAPLVDVTVVRQ